MLPKLSHLISMQSISRVLTRLLREPLLQFFLLGGLVFGLYALLHHPASDDRAVTVTPGKLRELVSTFAASWRRTPTSDELSALVDQYVQDEILYREALRIGLDRDDVVVRRRLAQKLSFLLETRSIAPADDSQLAAFLDAHSEDFRSAPQIAFTQLFVDSDKRGANAPLVARRLLRSLTTSSSAVRGDATLLEAEVPLSPLPVIAAQFGEEFARSLAKLPVGIWSGPVNSGFGLHLVRVARIQPGRVAPLGEIRSRVEQAWLAERLEASQREAYRELRAKYAVNLESIRNALP
jgi:PPIC-type PPIASE domain